VGLKLLEISNDERIFIDANIFLYSAFEHPIFGNTCKKFLQRIESNDVKGFTSDFVLNEVFHRLMIAEVADKQGTSSRKIPAMIKREPEIIKELNIVWKEMELIGSFGLTLLEGSIFPDFIEISKKHQLMATDAAHLAIMRNNGIRNLASNDSDFRRVPWIKLWMP
jgi:predicted nucleic acid-binding protein